jgi:hypothetical protein
MELTDDEVLANRVGLLARSQSIRLRQREARSHRRAALCLLLALLGLALMPLSLSLSLLLALGGLSGATLFYLVARKNRAARQALFPSVRCISVTESSRRWGRALRLEPGKRYEVYFVEPTRTLLGWRQLGTQKEIT